MSEITDAKFQQLKHAVPFYQIEDWLLGQGFTEDKIKELFKGVAADDLLKMHEFIWKVDLQVPDTPWISDIKSGFRSCGKSGDDTFNMNELKRFYVDVTYSEPPAYLGNMFSVFNKDPASDVITCDNILKYEKMTEDKIRKAQRAQDVADFRSWDTDNNDTLSLAEYRNKIKNCNDETIKRIFADDDLNGDEMVSELEYLILQWSAPPAQEWRYRLETAHKNMIKNENARREREHRLSELFAKHDVGNKDFLEFNEAKAAAAKTSKKITEDVFTGIDVDKDSKLSLEEFLVATKAARPDVMRKVREQKQELKRQEREAANRKKFNSLDTNNSGTLTYNEVKGDFVMEDSVGFGDLDGDRQLSIEEYLFYTNCAPPHVKKIAEMKKAFRVVDKAKKGLVSKADFKKTYVSLGNKLKDEELNGICDTFGYIKVNDFIEAEKTRSKIPQYKARGAKK